MVSQKPGPALSGHEGGRAQASGCEQAFASFGRYSFTCHKGSALQDYWQALHLEAVAANPSSQIGMVPRETGYLRGEVVVRFSLFEETAIAWTSRFGVADEGFA